MVVSGWQLDLMISEVFSNLLFYDSMNKKYASQKKVQEINGMYFFLNPHKGIKYPNEPKPHLWGALRRVMRGRHSLARQHVLLMAWGRTTSHICIPPPAVTSGFLCRSVFQPESLKVFPKIFINKKIISKGVKLKSTEHCATEPASPTELTQPSHTMIHQPAGWGGLFCFW